MSTSFNRGCDGSANREFNPAWELVFAHNPQLRKRICGGDVNPIELAKAFRLSFALDDDQEAVIRAVLAARDAASFVEHASAEGGGPTNVLMIDFAMDEKFTFWSGDEKLISLAPPNLAAVVRDSVNRRSADNVAEHGSLDRAEIVMAGRVAAFVCTLYPRMGRRLEDGGCALSYTELRDWLIQRTLPNEKRPLLTAPDALMLAIETVARLKPGGIADDFRRCLATDAELALGLRRSIKGHDALEKR